LDPDPESGSVLVSNVKLWIRIRKKLIRIHNTDFFNGLPIGLILGYIQSK
jgi:hypothetical protein